MNRILTAIAVVALAAVAVVVLQSRGSAPPDPLGAAFAQAADVDTSQIPEMTLGNPEATVTVIEYASFTCPHCAAFHAENFKKLKADYIDTGKINFIYREVYFDRFGLWAAIVARCGENPESRYFGIADRIYSTQSEWARQDNPQAIVDSLRKIGKTAGLSDADLDQCLTDAANAEALYALWQKRSADDGIDSTPSFVINGKKYTNMPYDEMKSILDAALGG